jgi:antitoxin PrlF
MSDEAFVATVTSKGQVTVPAEVRSALGIEVGDKIEFLVDARGTYRIRARKRRSIVDLAKANPIKPAPPGAELDRMIDASVGEAMVAQDRRSRRGRRK